MKRIMYAVPLLALALTGCGGDDPTAGAPSAAAPSASAKPVPAGGYRNVDALAAALRQAGVTCDLKVTTKDTEGRCDATGGSYDIVVVADPASLGAEVYYRQSSALRGVTITQGANWLAACEPGPKPCDAIATALGGKVLPPKTGRTETPPLKTP